jgi:CheY-like chemotaxis protein/HPt (histidine-containing phosphotransfer) domain-containing protein
MPRPRSRILIIEDTAEMAEMLLVGLQQDGLETECVRDGAEALAWVRQQKFDLVLLDLGLPGMDGMEVLRRVKQDPGLAHIPVIVMTGRQGTADKLQAFEAGAADYVTKPFVLVEMRARVESILRSKRLQDELSAANQQLSARAEFLAKTSHEIRTQLGAVTAMSTLLLETELNPQQREYLGTIRASGESVLTLLNDILNVSKIEAGKLELEERPFHLRLCVDEAFDLLAAKAAEKNVELLCDIAPGIPEEVVGDGPRLRQVLVNLVSNAVKFTGSGEVVVRVEVEPAAPPAEMAGDTASIPFFHFSVRDTGIGIPASRLDRLFQSFSQMDSSISRQYGGSGLGLFISKGLVGLMGGRLWAESVEGRGSTFHFTAPLPVAPQPTSAAWQGPQPHLRGRCALIVDDNPTGARLLAREAHRWGMTAITVFNGAQALEFLGRDAGFDIIVIESFLPDMDGAALGHKIRSLLKPRRIPLVLMVPIGAPPVPAELGEDGVVTSVSKPVKPAFLHAAFLRALAVDARPEANFPAGRNAPVSKLDGGLAARVPLRILLTDDNVINQKVGSRMLKQFGYQADIASSGNEALEILQRTTYDVVFMDVQMPGIDGLETTRRIRALEKQIARPPAYIVAMTANAMPGDREKCLASGMDEYLAKPVQPEALQSLLAGRGKVAAKEAAAPLIPMAPPPASAVPKPAQAFDMNRLTDFAGGSPESLIEIIDLYLNQTTEQIDQMKACLAAGDRARLGRLAHTCAGASGICGMNAMSTVMRELEHACTNGHTRPLPPLFEMVGVEFESTRDFLLNHRRAACPA